MENTQTNNDGSSQSWKITDDNGKRKPQTNPDT